MNPLAQSLAQAQQELALAQAKFQVQAQLALVEETVKLLAEEMAEVQVEVEALVQAVTPPQVVQRAHLVLVR
jgi:cob(I)alamin adenosyltransferase